MLICCEIIMYLCDQLQKVNNFGNSLLCLDFIDPFQNHCLFHQSSAMIVHILEIIYK